MRANIVLDEKLLQQAFQYARVKTKRELVDLALREFVAIRARPDVGLLKGKIQLAADYDHKAMRAGS